VKDLGCAAHHAATLLLPAPLAWAHGGSVRVELHDASPGAVAVVAPMLATVRSGWLQLF
jgi:hypothetical protein